MSARIEIPMALETSGIAKGAADGKKALADLEKAVGDVASESGKTGGKVDGFASKLVDAARKAGKADDEIRDALKDMGVSAKDADRELSRMGDTAQDAGRDGADGVDKLEQELKDVQSQSDTTASKVDGVGEAAKNTGVKMNRAMGTDIRQGINAVGDLLDGRVAGGMNNLLNATTSISQHLPVVGVGIAAAAGLAAPALAALSEEQEKQNAAVQRMKEYFSDAWQAASAGGRDYIDQMTVIAEMQDIMFSTDREEERNRIQEDANKLGLDRNTLLRAAAGDQTALNAVTGRANELVAEQNELVTDSEDIRTKGRGPKEAAASQELADLQAINDRWKQYGQINDENRQKAAESAQAISDYFLDLVASSETAGVSIDAVGNKMIELPDGTTFFVDAETGQATQDLDKFEGDADGVIDRLNGQEVKLRIATGQAISTAQSAVDRIGRMGATVKLRADTSAIFSAARRALNAAIGGDL